MGMVMGEGKIVYWRWVNPFNNPEKFCIYYLGQFWVGLPALPALIQGTLQHFGHDPILGGFLAEPSQTVLNGLHPRLGKLVEIGTIYTTVAGLLNILAIYDAYEGPAYQEYEEEHASPVSSGALGGGRRLEGGRIGMIMASGPGLLARLTARGRDQRRLLGLTPRVVAADLVAFDPSGSVDPGAARRRHGGVAFDQYAGLEAEPRPKIQGEAIPSILRAEQVP